MPSADLLATVRVRHPTLEKLQDSTNDTTRAWRVPGYKGSVGFISSMSDHFCGSCSRLRVGAEGSVKVRLPFPLFRFRGLLLSETRTQVCLFGPPVLSLRALLRAEPPTADQVLLDKIGAVVGQKKFAHDGLKGAEGIHRDGRSGPMVSIGG